MGEESGQSAARSQSNDSNTGYQVGLVAIVVAIILVGLLMTKENIAVAWVLTLVLMGSFIAVAGKSITGVWRGDGIGDVCDPS